MSRSEETEPDELIEEDSAPVGPSEAEESAFLTEVTSVPAPAPGPTVSIEDEPIGELPALAGLVERIPSHALKIMDDLFRAKFIAVRRVPAWDLKKKSSGGSRPG
ncbi:MAG: hypothetical protein K9M98_01660 [Cephaloticoccus sp.]|nr:hypothetical protein [Cephaloticoccus sp.]MCF7759185.1 hypothetical protein [Cephaloticoccus sp.]